MKRQKVKDTTNKKAQSTGSFKPVVVEQTPGAATADHHPHEMNGNVKSVDHSHARISELAYAFYERDGYRHGYDLEHWLRAEQELQRQES